MKQNRIFYVFTDNLKNNDLSELFYFMAETESQQPSGIHRESRKELIDS